MAGKKVLCVVPARYASTRLPGKPLADIAGKPMIARVYDRALLAKEVDEVVVATDHEKVYDAIESIGGKVVMTLATHPSGTDRLAEVATMYNEADIIVNVQGDEPLINPEIIDELVLVLKNEPSLKMATVKTVMEEDEYNNPAAVKVVTDKDGYALYFSRSILPYPRNEDGLTIYKHLGIYAYKREFLLEFAKMQQSYLEKIESLEQLRALENGYKIKVILTDSKCVGVDTEEDLALVNKIFKNLEK